MKHIKRCTLLMLILVIAFSMLAAVDADAVKNTAKAEKLQLLGLLRGTEKGFSLDKTFTRAEGAVMIIRLSGLEKQALADDSKAVFKDVGKGHWAVRYVNYAYKNQIVNGTSKDTYSPENTMNGKQYITLVLRALGYKEAKPETAFPLAVQSGLLSLKRADELTKKKVFMRDDMVEVSYNALCTKLKGSPKTLFQQLVEDKKLVSRESAMKSGLYKESSLIDKIEAAIKAKLGHRAQ